MENPEKFIVVAGGRIRCLRCTALSKNTREQCRKPALKISRTQKCGHHGGRGSGPKTAEAKARIAAAHRVHGMETVDAGAELTRCAGLDLTRVRPMNALVSRCSALPL